MKKIQSLIFSAFLLTALAVNGLLAADESKKAPAKEITITGQVIDPACYIKEGRSGPEHKKCAQACAKAGQSLAILDKKTGKIYVSIGAEMMDDPNAKIFDLAEEKVKVTGKVYEKGGISAIVISKAEKLVASK